MEKTYKVTIKTKKGYPMPDAEKVRNAVFGTGTSYEAINNVEVEEVSKPKFKFDFGKPIYALGRLSPNTGKEWIFIEYFNNYKKAIQAKDKSEKKAAGMGNAFADDKFSVFIFSPLHNMWNFCF